MPSTIEAMKRLAAALLLLGTVLVSSGSASPVYLRAKFSAPPGHHVLGEPVAIRLVSTGNVGFEMGETWDLTHIETGQTAFYQWPEDERMVSAYDEREWVWDQRVNQCYGECVNVREGDPAPAGRYEVTTTVNGKTKTARFTLGQYFTLGFEARPNIEFTAFVGTQPEIDQMTAEAEAEDKTKIVSGIVRKGRGYNPDWNFSMGPHSIELGEVFIEVCDGSPFYVQRHRDEWLKERWCPWDSYVKRVGR